MNIMNVLVFGGNGFIGSTTVRELLDIKDCNITVLNRGRSWDWDKAEVIKPHVRCIQWDRKRPLEDCSELKDLNEKVNWQVVIDFSAYDGHAVRNACQFLGDKILLYIYVSSDSVYEVCEKTNGNDSSSLTKETEATRPSSKTTYKTLKRQDSYGHKKLKGEEELIKAHKKYDFKYVILRLADVVGPMDSTDRWWSLQLWTTFCAEKNRALYLPKETKSTPLSLVYSKDIAQLVKRLTQLTQANELSSEVINQAYNLACKETPTLETIVQDISTKITGKPVEIRYVEDSSEVPDYYPSVERGPIDIAKAQSLLQWTPTPIKEVIDNTVEFYKSCSETQGQYDEEKTDIYQDTKKDISHLYDTEELKFLKSILKLNV